MESSTSKTSPEISSVSAISRKKTPTPFQSGSTPAQNKKKLTKLCPGMTRQKVVAIMGTAPGISSKGTFKNPYRIVKHRSKRHVFELLLYCTDIGNHSRFITDTELTPLVLMDGKLDGWGWPFWNKVVLLLQKDEGGLKPFLPWKGDKIKKAEKKSRLLIDRFKIDAV